MSRKTKNACYCGCGGNYIAQAQSTGVWNGQRGYQNYGFDVESSRDPRPSRNDIPYRTLETELPHA